MRNIELKVVEHNVMVQVDCQNTKGNSMRPAIMPIVVTCEDTPDIDCKRFEVAEEGIITIDKFGNKSGFIPFPRLEYVKPAEDNANQTSA